MKQNNKKSNKSIKKQDIKVIVTNKPTPAQAKAKIKEISDHINKMFSNKNID